VPQDIHSASPIKKLVPESESKKVDKPPSPSTGKTFLEMSKPSGPEDTNASTSVASNPASSSAPDSVHDVAHQSPRPDPTECQEAFPQSPMSFGLGAHCGPQTGEGSSVPRPEKQLRQYLRVVESLWDNLDFIQAGFHIGQYMTVSVNTKAKWEHIKTLYSSMKTTSELVHVSIYASPYIFILRLDSSLI
jgi:hypothetical protein